MSKIKLKITFNVVFPTEESGIKFANQQMKIFQTWFTGYKQYQNPDLNFEISFTKGYLMGNWLVDLIINVEYPFGLVYGEFSLLSKLSEDLFFDSLENSYLIKSINFSVGDL